MHASTELAFECVPFRIEAFAVVNANAIVGMVPDTFPLPSHAQHRSDAKTNMI